MELYVTDLDGTLLNSKCKISKESIKVINNLIEKGCNFTVATARSLSSARDILEPLDLKMPVILNNGGFIYDLNKNENLVSNYIENEIAKEVISEVRKVNLNPFVHLEINNENKLYYSGLFNYGEQFYYDLRMKAKDDRFEEVIEYDVKNKKVITIFLIGNEKELNDICNVLEKKFPELQYHLFLDVYSNYFWFEINNINATKKNGIKFLKNYLNIENVSCFGDNLNDISMFEECNFSYAVENAHVDLKKIASEIIESNENDGVAKCLERKCIYD